MSVTTTEDSHRRACGDCDTLTRLSSPGDAWSNMKDGGEGQFPTIPLRSKTNHVQHLGPDYLMFIKVRKWFSFKMKK